MKRILILLLSFAIFISLLGIETNAANYISVTVGGESVKFDQRPIIENGRVLIPLRAVCEKIGTTVNWDLTEEIISITDGNKNLTLTIGSNLMQLSDGTTEALDVPPKIYNGRALIPIRAVVEQFGYTAEWNSKQQVVSIEEIGARIVPTLSDTQAWYVPNWADISSVQQFPYRDEGLAFAYVSKRVLIITTPSKIIELDAKYPLLGDVIADDDGNFYIVWGKSNSTNIVTETLFISKYTPDGDHVKTIGFTGASTQDGNSDSGKTRIPFDAGNCVTVIADGILVCYHSKERYDGHQGDIVIAVNISDMSVHNLRNNTYSGHSFNQSVIFSSITSGFLFASHSDAYARGFRVNGIDGKYGKSDEILFHFFLEANADYNMRIVNKTFAQLGGLAETSAGVALVGASAKSISNAAKSEKQNLFIQIFDPRFESVTPQIFAGGVIRSGATSFNIYDNSNSPLKSVSDYGVHWLTDYTDTDVIAPQVVTADDMLVILWSTNEDTYYTVLEANGIVLTPATSLHGTPLNSYERPVYHEGTVYWASVKDERLMIRSIPIA